MADFFCPGVFATKDNETINSEQNNFAFTTEDCFTRPNALAFFV